MARMDWWSDGEKITHIHNAQHELERGIAEFVSLFLSKSTHLQVASTLLIHTEGSRNLKKYYAVNILGEKWVKKQ